MHKAQVTLQNWLTEGQYFRAQLTPAKRANIKERKKEQIAHERNRRTTDRKRYCKDANDVQTIMVSKRLNFISKLFGAS